MSSKTNNLDISLAAAVLGRMGGLVGGKSRSNAKSAAARENGKKGGRPRKNRKSVSEI